MSDAERWDARHAARIGDPLEAPDDFVVEALERLGPGGGRRALDLAAGGGRHAVYLARAGWLVSAWDRSPAALRRIAARAGECGLEIEGREVELGGGLALAPPGSVELALVVNFLHRALYRDLAERIVPGGHVILASFTRDREGDHPRLEWCLEPGELARGIAGFETLLALETGGRAGLLARRSPGGAD